MTGPVGYWHVDDIRQSPQRLVDAGAQPLQDPLGLHRVTVREISGPHVRIGPIEAVDGTPVVDVKPVLVHDGDA